MFNPFKGCIEFQSEPSFDGFYLFRGGIVCPFFDELLILKS